MRRARERINGRHVLSIIAVAMLTACGGGGSAPAGSTSSNTVAISGKAVDGPLQGAFACYDLNDNGRCDSAEPTSSPTGASGAFSFDVPAAEAGKHRVVVEVPATAIDADTGVAVGTAFSLQSPATGSSGAQQVFASPLTTLVQAHVDATGATVAAASDFIKAQAGLAISPLADFTAGSATADPNAAKVARLVQVTTLQQGAAVASVTGMADLNGTSITPSDVANVVTLAVVSALPAVASLVKDPAIANASGAALQTAIQSAATTVVAQIGLDTATVAAQITAAKAPDTSPTTTPEAAASLTALEYIDVNNWYYRVLASTVEDNTPDANGKVRYYELRQRSRSSSFSPNGVVRGWAFSNNQARSGDLHWNGGAWASCNLGDRNSQTVRDSKGRNTYDYCAGFEQGTGLRSAVDLSGQSIASVFTNSIRKYPGGAGGVLYANWGPADVNAAFGSATFPTGSKLFYQVNTVTATALSYDVQISANVKAFSTAVAAGGDARTGAPDCSVSAKQVLAEIVTLEDLITRSPGTPCVFAGTVGASLVPDEWWGNATASVGSIANGLAVPPSTTRYSTTQSVRVAFSPLTASTGTASYYSCYTFAANGSPRNCSLISTGSYLIQSLGDGRAMVLSGMAPDMRAKLGYDRVFVERGGKVHFGYKNIVGQINNQLRMNLPAANAVFTSLHLPPIRPVRRPADLDAASAAALSTAKGVYVLNDPTAQVGLFFRFGDNGRMLMAQAKPLNQSLRDGTGLELGWLDYQAGVGSITSLLELDTNMTAGTSHSTPPAAGSPGIAITASGIVVPNGPTLTRFAASPGSPLVGVWARNSATELNTQHFVFFADGTVMMIDPQGDISSGPCQLADQGPPGVEYASYTFDAATGALHVFGKVHDTNGCAGFFDSSLGAVQPNTEANGTLTISTAGGVTTIPLPDGSTLYRVAP
jgi:hypothetical protein